MDVISGWSVCHSLHAGLSLTDSVSHDVALVVLNNSAYFQKIKRFENSWCLCIVRIVYLSGTFLRVRKCACAYNLTLQVWGLSVTAKAVLRDHSKSTKNDLNDKF